MIPTASPWCGRTQGHDIGLWAWETFYFGSLEQPVEQTDGEPLKVGGHWRLISGQRWLTNGRWWRPSGESRLPGAGLNVSERARQAEMERLVRTRHRDAMILERRAGDPKKHMRTSTEISAEATALIKETERRLAELEAQGRGRRDGESIADWIARVEN
jgi:hypothetical protein